MDLTVGPCYRCKRAAGKRRALYYRPRGGPSALFAGRFGRACFYMEARALAAAGAQPEYEDARVITLRGQR